jgi:hypothetical protein
VPFFAKLYQETPWWQAAAFRLAALFPRLSRKLSPGLGERELARQFCHLLENEDVDEVFREFRVSPPAEESGAKPAGEKTE